MSSQQETEDCKEVDPNYNEHALLQPHDIDEIRVVDIEPDNSDSDSLLGRNRYDTPGRVSSIEDAGFSCSISFEVTKVLSYNRRQTRTLRLTKDGIENLRPRGECTSFARWEDITCASVNENGEVTVEYVNRDTPRVYCCEDPHALVDSINETLQSTLEGKTCQENLLDYLRREALDVNKREGEECQDIRRAILVDIQIELRSVSQIQKIRGYLNEFSRLLKSIHWKYLHDTLKNDWIEREEKLIDRRESSASYLTESLHSKEVDDLGDTLESHDSYVEAPEQPMKKRVLDIDGIVDHLVERVVQESVLCHAARDLMAICSETYGQEDSFLHQEILRMQTWRQDRFEIAKDIQDPRGWREAVSTLSFISDLLYPIDKIECLASAADAIMRRHADIAIEKGEDECKPLAGDDIIPIFHFVLIQTSRHRIINWKSELEFTKLLCDRDLQNYSRCGYYLVTMEAVLQNILNRRFV